MFTKNILRFELSVGAVSSTGKAQRPKLVMEVGGKGPHLLRQRYLDKIIDELIPKCESEKEAIEKVCLFPSVWHFFSFCFP